MVAYLSHLLLKWERHPGYTFLISKGATAKEALYALEKCKGKALDAYRLIARRRTDARYARDLVRAQQESEASAKKQRAKEEQAIQLLLMSGGDVIESGIFKDSVLLSIDAKNSSNSENATSPKSSLAPFACCPAFYRACEGVVGCGTSMNDFAIRTECLQILQIEKKAIGFYDIARDYMRGVAQRLTAVATKASVEGEVGGKLPLEALKEEHEKLKTALYSMPSSQGGAPAAFLEAWAGSNKDDDIELLDSKTENHRRNRIKLQQEKLANAVVIEEEEEKEEVEKGSVLPAEKKSKKRKEISSTEEAPTKKSKCQVKGRKEEPIEIL
eukprot:g5955.t1